MSTSDSPKGCNVSMTFNYTVGVLATLAAGAIGYFLYRWLFAG